LHAERAGAVERLDTVVGAKLLHLVDIDDGVEVLRHLVEQLGERLLQPVLDGVVIDGDDLVEITHAPFHQALGLGRLPALVGRHDVLRRHLLAAAEAYVVAQLEGVDQPVR